MATLGQMFEKLKTLDKLDAIYNHLNTRDDFDWIDPERVKAMNKELNKFDANIDWERTGQATITATGDGITYNTGTVHPLQNKINDLANNLESFDNTSAHEKAIKVATFMAREGWFDWNSGPTKFNELVDNLVKEYE